MTKNTVHHDVVYNSIKLLQSRGLSVSEISKRAGVSTWTIYSALRGGNVRSATYIGLLAVIEETEPKKGFFARLKSFFR